MALRCWAIRARLTVLIVLSLSLTGSLTPRVSAQSAPDMIWVGTMTLTHQFRPAEAFIAADWDGAFQDARTISLRMREVGARNVVNDKGRIIGQIVRLEDAGTTWTGTVTSSERHLGTIRLAADGAGSGKAQIFGVMYRSAVTPNPLADVAPDGAYTLSVFATEIAYTQRIIEPNRRTETSQGQSMAGASLGDAVWGFRMTMAKEPLTEASVRAAMSLNPPGLMPSEGKIRTLTGDRLSLETTITGTGDAAGSTTSITINASRELNVSAELTETDRAWRPELTAERTYTATIDPALNIKGRFRFTLFEVGREAGDALNHGSDPTLDLGFSPDQTVSITAPKLALDGWSVETTSDAASASIVVRALDYGAYGKLKAEVFVGGKWHPARTVSGGDAATIPFDSNGNKIADSWEDANGVLGQAAEADEDEMPAGSNRGDGLSNYEEYRGFYVDGQWTDTRPIFKDLFVNNEATWDGCGFVDTSGIDCHVIRPDEYDANRFINVNRGFATLGGQKGLWVTTAAGLLSSTGATVTMPPMAMGAAYPTVGVPNNVDYILLALDSMTKFITASAGPDGLPTVNVDARKSVIAHEIGHGINLDHHGPWQHGGTCSTSADDLVTSWNGVTAGDRECVMSYIGASRYQWRDGTCHDWIWPLKFGQEWCKSKSGTGINAPPDRMDNGHPMPPSGDATNGDCWHTLRIKR